MGAPKGKKRAKKKKKAKNTRKKAPEPAPPRLPPVTPGQVHDLTDFASPPFRYKLQEMKDGQPTNKTVEISLDHEMIAIDLASRLPTAMKGYGDMEKGPDGKMHQKSGLHVIIQSFYKGEATPSDLPSFKEVLLACRVVFQIPAEYGSGVVQAVMQAYMRDSSARYILKKGTPGLHGFAAPSQAS